MRQVKISRWLASITVCSLLLAAGCAPAGKEAAKPKVKSGKVATIALKFSPGDLTTYKVINEVERSIKWEGSVPDESIFKGGRNYDKQEMIFAQEIQSIDDKGNAIAKITIKEIKYSSIVKDSSVFEFDTANPTDPQHPLALLIGQSYTIKIAPSGEVIEVIDIKEANAASRKGSVPPRIASRMLSKEAIKERHGNLVLPNTDKNQLQTGDNWSITKAFSFGMMGAESYEKIYTLNQIKSQDKRQVAVIKMNAIPASETSKGHEAKFLERSDNTKTYAGELELDLTAGKVKKYYEKLQQEWTTDFPSGQATETDQEPVILTMSATRFYSLEKID
ncbi:MAG: DUF6263 family protein [Phycisphaerae bacterium]|nr:DUF6263 family protein [Phycisphaerae bacterium]MDD5380594.1 DUF6263 family protein [Phycisphaerae bacterium]